jgi:hypothetical protein
MTGNQVSRGNAIGPSGEVCGKGGRVTTVMSTSRRSTRRVPAGRTDARDRAARPPEGNPRHGGGRSGYLRATGRLVRGDLQPRLLNIGTLVRNRHSTDAGRRDTRRCRNEQGKAPGRSWSARLGQPAVTRRAAKHPASRSQRRHAPSRGCALNAKNAPPCQLRAGYGGAFTW